MTRRTLNEAHKYRELHQHFEHHPALMGSRKGGPHTIYRGPNGSVPVPNHNGDCPRGTLKSICRMALLAGLGCLTLIVAVLVRGIL